MEDRPEETRLPSVKGPGAKTTASKKMPENCKQKCNNNGSCTTEYVGPYRAGPNKGSCFPKRFGGQCRNIPPECDACNKVQECPQPWERWRQQCKKWKLICDELLSEIRKWKYKFGFGSLNIIWTIVFDRYLVLWHWWLVSLSSNDWTSSLLLLSRALRTCD